MNSALPFNKIEKNWLQATQTKEEVNPSSINSGLPLEGQWMPNPEELVNFIQKNYDLDPRTRIVVNTQTAKDRDTAKNILQYEESESLREVIEKVKGTLNEFKRNKMEELNNKITQAETNSKRMNMRSPMIDIYNAKKAIWSTFEPTLYQFSVTARFYLYICRENNRNSSYPPSNAQFVVINDDWKASKCYPKEHRYGSRLNPILLADSDRYFDLYIQYDRIRYQTLLNNKDPLADRLSDLDKSLPSIDSSLQFIYHHLSFHEGTNFSSRNLTHLFLHALSIPKSTLSNSNFSNSKLHNSSLPYSFAENAKFNECDLREANLRGCNFRNCQFRKADFRGATLTDVQFTNCDLEGADFSSGLTEMTVFNSVTLEVSESVIFVDCNLQSCNFAMANLQGINLQRNRLENANFQGTNLSYSELAGLQLKSLQAGQIVAEYTNSGNQSIFNTYKTSLAYSNCYNCTFEGIDLSLIDTSRANMSDCVFDDCCLDLMKMRACLLSNATVKANSRLFNLTVQLISVFIEKGVNFEQYPPSCLDSLVIEGNNSDQFTVPSS